MTTPTNDPPEVLARVRAGLPLVAAIARQMRHHAPHDVNRDDLVGFGQEALLRAARTFDPSLGVPFERWAALRIRGGMIDGIRATGLLPRRVYNELRALELGDRMQEALVEEDAAKPAPTAEAADQRLASYLAGIATAMAIGVIGPPDEKPAHEETPEEALARAELHQELREAIARLPETERKLVERQYLDEARLMDTAAELGLKPSWACRLLGRAVESIARDLKKRRITR